MVITFIATNTFFVLLLILNIQEMVYTYSKRKEGKHKLRDSQSPSIYHLVVFFFYLELKASSNLFKFVESFLSSSK